MQRIGTIEKLIRRIGFTAALILLPAMMVSRLTEMTLRSMHAPGAVFNAVEAELFLLFAFLIAGAAAVNDSHVRVDIFRDRFGPRLRAWIEIFGTVFFLLPFTAAVVWYGSVMVAVAWGNGEAAALALGAPLRWVILLSVPVGIGLLALAILCRTVRHAAFLLGRGPSP